MASFWDKVKSWMGGAPPVEEAPEATPELPLPPGVSSALAKRVEAEVVRRVGSQQPFEPIVVAGAVLAETGDQQSIKALVAASAVVDWLHDGARLAPLGYTRTKQASGNWLYHPVGWSPASPGPQPAPNPGAPPPRQVAAPPPTRPAAQAPAKPPAKKVDPFAAPGILGLSAAELRKRALRIDPYRTAWIGRTDTIPPQSDERTAIIDRGLVLRGLLTEKQLEEIHRVGDLWLRHHEAAKLAASLAQGEAERAVADAQRARAERKAQKKREAEARAKRRAADVARRRKEDIVFLGAGVSKGLADRRSHVEALLDRGLPVLSTPADVARAMGVTLSELRFLAFHAEATEKPHYVTFEIPKRSGGKRLLSAPMPRLARAQAWVLHEVLEKLPTEEPAHGFIKGRSTVTCARPHVGRELVVNLDLSDFFPTITFGRVRGVFQRLGYSPAVATVLALLCTEPPRARVEYDGKRWYAAVGPRALPQGACTSPAISNQVARKLDRRLAGMARKHGLTYTRYADDLTFSSGKLSTAEIGMLMARVRHVVSEEGFALNPKKGRVQRASGRQTVTGIVVNDRPGVPREEVRRLRAILHHAEKTGLAAQNRGQIPHFEAHLRGKLAYLHMIDPARAAPLMAQLEAIAARAP